MAEYPVNKSMMPDFYNSIVSIVWQLWDEDLVNESNYNSPFSLLPQLQYGMKLVLVQQPSVVVWFVHCNPPSKHLANLLILKYVFVAVRGCCNSCSCFIFEPGSNRRVCNGMQWVRTKKSAQLKSDAISCGSPHGRNLMQAAWQTSGTTKQNPLSDQPDLAHANKQEWHSKVNVVKCKNKSRASRF